MTYCVNPDCPNPENADTARECVTCGSSLILNGRYRPIRVLGQGGFGATFVARNMALPGEPVCAVKQLRVASDNPQVIDRARRLFKREATALGKIGNHPQVPSLLDYFEDHYQFYLVQEYIKGWTLKQEVKRSGVFDEAKICSFLQETLTLLKYFQDQEVIHRDIKPANIIRRSIDNHLVFIDFGAVKDEVSQTMLRDDHDDNPNTTFAIGTPGFAPPEQMSLRPIFASDIYALGATCLYLMTGQSPKRFGYNPMTGALNWRDHIYVSDGLGQLLTKMLEPTIQRRYSSAALVLNDLQGLMLRQAQAQTYPIAELSYDTPDNASYHFPNPASNSASMVNRSPHPSPHSVYDSSPDLNAAYEALPLPDAPLLDASLTGAPPSELEGLNELEGVAEGVKKWRSLDELRAEQNTVLEAPEEPGSRYNIPPLDDSNLAVPPAHRTGSTRLGRSSASPGSSAGERVTVRSLRQDYYKGRRDFANCNLSGADLHGMELAGINFNEAKLIRSNLNNVNFHKADLSQAGLSQASLREANLSGAFMSYANLAGADLRGADLREAYLLYANLNGANLCGANLMDAKVTPEQLSNAKTNWRTIMPNGKRGLF